MKRIYLLALTLAATPIFAGETKNLIANGDFEESTTVNTSTSSKNYEWLFDHDIAPSGSSRRPGTGHAR